MSEWEAERGREREGSGREGRGRGREKRRHRQTNRRGAQEQPLSGHAASPAPINTQAKEIDIRSWEALFPPRSVSSKVQDLFPTFLFGSYVQTSSMELLSDIL